MSQNTKVTITSITNITDKESALISSPSCSLALAILSLLISEVLNVLHTALAPSLIRGSVCVIAFASLPGNMLVVHRPVWHSTPVEKQGLPRISAVLSCFRGYENVIPREGNKQKEKKEARPRRISIIHAFGVNISISVRALL